MSSQSKHVIDSLDDQQIVDLYYRHSDEKVELLRRVLALLKVVGSRRIYIDDAEKLLRAGYGFDELSTTDFWRDFFACEALGLLAMDEDELIYRKPGTEFWPFNF